jgi:hypothetical protein
MKYKNYRCVEWIDENTIVINATSKYYANKIFLMNSDGTDIKEITPFNAEIVAATSLNLN